MDVVRLITHWKKGHYTSGDSGLPGSEKEAEAEEEWEREAELIGGGDSA